MRPRRRRIGAAMAGSTASLWNRARGARWGSSSQPRPSRPSPASQCPWRAARIFSGKELRRGEAPLGKMGPAAFASLGRSAAPFRQAAHKPLDRASCRQEIRTALGTLRGRLRVRWKRPALRSRSLSGWNRPLTRPMRFRPFPGPLVAALFLLGPTRHDGNLSRKQCDRV